jgi:membrane protein DedA with SNARE-associated domain
MVEIAAQSGVLFCVFGLVFLLNLMPAFAPPTWTVLAGMGLSMPQSHFGLTVLTAASAATLGRIGLAKLSTRIVRQSLLSEAARRNVDKIKEGLERRRGLSFGLFLFYAFSPLPSNYLFIGYGMTALPLATVALPFFIGRSCSYAIALTGATLAADALHAKASFGPWMCVYFIISQAVLVPAMYCFTRIDWQHAFEKRTLKWIKGAAV